MFLLPLSSLKSFAKLTTSTNFYRKWIPVLNSSLVIIHKKHLQKVSLLSLKGHKFSLYFSKNHKWLLTESRQRVLLQCMIKYNHLFFSWAGRTLSTVALKGDFITVRTDNQPGFSESNKWQGRLLPVALKQCNILELREESTQVVFESSVEGVHGDKVALFPFFLNRAGSKYWNSFAHTFVLECFWSVKRLFGSHHGNWPRC